MLADPLSHVAAALQPIHHWVNTLFATVSRGPDEVRLTSYRPESPLPVQRHYPRDGNLMLHPFSARLLAYCEVPNRLVQ
jgi:hypothetical protein